MYSKYYFNMKKIISQSHILPLLLLGAGLLLQTACQKSGNGAPSISLVRNYAASPMDTVVTVANPGQWVVVQGNNLSNAQSVLFDGFPATLNNSLATNQSLVLQIPQGLALGSVDSGKINTIQVITKSGQVTFKLSIVPPAPVILSISNEMAHPGDTVVIFGYNYFFIKSITYPGNLNITNYGVNATGTEIALVIPAGLSQAGPVILTTQSGADTTIYNVNDPVTGILSNFDNINNFNPYSSSSVVTNDPVAYPDGLGNYAHMTFALTPAGDWGDGNSGRRTILNTVQWVPVANTNDPVGNWAVKFEINVKNPWSAGCLFVQDWGWNHTCRFEPWKTAPGGVFTTHGWETITLPLSNFLTKINNVDGTGSPATTVANLLTSDNVSTGATGAAPLAFLFDNPLVAVDNFDIAIDNIRIVKIR